MSSESFATLNFITFFLVEFKHRYRFFRMSGMERKSNRQTTYIEQASCVVREAGGRGWPRRLECVQGIGDWCSPEKMVLFIKELRKGSLLRVLFSIQILVIRSRKILRVLRFLSRNAQRQWKFLVIRMIERLGWPFFRAITKQDLYLYEHVLWIRISYHPQTESKVIRVDFNF